MESQTALLIQRRAYKDPDLLQEFEAIATTAGYTVIASFDVVTPPSARYGISVGKVEEIATFIEVDPVDFVLFSPHLKSSQLFRLMERFEIEVRDRSQVILEIFDRHAQTPQAKLQIEQARLRYEQPFERHQIKMRLQNEHTGDRPTTDQVGAGEDLLTKRMSEIRKRIALIEEKLRKISRAQKLKRKRRSKIGFLEVTLAGYTNAGKSTLHNGLTGSEVEIADKLFTTLSTKTTRLESLNRQVVISDSVGFISDLPNQLLKAFNTTLMEIAEADVIILVVDASDSVDEMERKIDTCLVTFADIEANGIPVVMAINKIDLISKDDLDEKMQHFTNHVNAIVAISAKDETGFENLLEVVDSELPKMYTYNIELPHGNEGMSIVSWLHEVGDVKNSAYKETSILVQAELEIDMVQRLLQMHPDISVRRTESD
ncbi:MAG: GTPase HflX [Candidatus Thorarchaeota archaeon]|jgi:GTP-binding protein HflX